jgi:hypothetical protein
VRKIVETAHPLVEMGYAMKEKVVRPAQEIVDNVHLLMLAPPNRTQILEFLQMLQSLVENLVGAALREMEEFLDSFSSEGYSSL